jgi:hypothetical protein
VERLCEESFLLVWYGLILTRFFKPITKYQWQSILEDEVGLLEKVMQKKILVLCGCIVFDIS